MSDSYCPPPDPSDYLDGGIQYPNPVGKEKIKSVDNDHNDINYDDPKIDKNLNVGVGLEDDMAKLRAKKLQTRIQSDLKNQTSKSIIRLRAPGDIASKSTRSVYPVQSNTIRKVVNEI